MNVHKFNEEVVIKLFHLTAMHDFGNKEFKKFRVKLLKLINDEIEQY